MISVLEPHLKAYDGASTGVAEEMNGYLKGTMLEADVNEISALVGKYDFGEAQNKLKLLKGKLNSS